MFNLYIHIYLYKLTFDICIIDTQSRPPKKGRWRVWGRATNYEGLIKGLVIGLVVKIGDSWW